MEKGKDAFYEDVEVFRQTDIEILKAIQPRWAFGENSDKIMNHHFLPDFGGDYNFYNVKVIDLMSHVEFFDFDIENLFIGDVASDYRVVTTLKRWMQNQYVDPSTLSINTKSSRKLLISDGRHRFKISKFLNLERIPVAISKSNVEKIKIVIDLELL